MVKKRGSHYAASERKISNFAAFHINDPQKRRRRAAEQFSGTAHGNTITQRSKLKAGRQAKKSIP